jgi:DNA primase
MSRISARSLEAVKERADIVELARARTELRQVRDEWIGRCPFHEERSPSFSVNAGKKLYYCFGCHAKGDVIEFVRQTEAVDYVGAIEWLASRYGLELEYEEASPVEEARRRRDDRLRTLLDETARWYARRLTSGAAGSAAREYLSGRGLGDEVIERYGVGLAPEGWDGLSRAAQGRGYTVDELVTAGLAVRARTGNVVDHFRGRLMFPIADARGRVVAFGGRVLPGSDDTRKYVNSPEGPLFHKGEVLYGLHLARTEIARRDLALVVEGYTDALALAQAGHPNVVASQGTALTERQLRLLRGLSRNVVLLFDGDAAGADAALRGVQLAEREGLSVRVAVLPKGLDPADAAIEQPDVLAAAVSGAPSVLAYRVQTQLDAADMSSATGRDAAFGVLRAILVDAPPSIERAELVQQVAGRLRLPADLTAELAPRRPQRRASRNGIPAARRIRLDPVSLDEQRLLALAVVEDDARAAVERLGEDSFGLVEHAAVARALIERAAERRPGEADAAVLADLEPELAARGAREARDAAAIADATRRVEAHAVERRMEPLKRKLQEDDITREEQQELLRLQALARELSRTS